MSRYETYKPSGVDWVGEVPEHWEVKRLKNIVLNDIGGIWGDEPAGDENDIIVLRVADFDRLKSRIFNNPDFTYRNIKESQLDGRLIKQGDILLEKSGGGEQQPVGKAVLFDKEFKAVTSNFINKIETLSNVNNHFALYLFDALYYNSINVRNIKQTTGIQNLDNTGYFGEMISLPPKPEQLAIANYLDDQTQKIDRLIANKKAQAEKLKELRQIEINNSVTKGLNPNAEMKDSGIEWLGKIPKHWEVKRLKNILLNINSGDGISNDELVEDGEIEVYGGNGVMGYTDKYNSDGKVIIIGRVGAKCGVVYLVDKKIWISDNALQSRTYQDYEFVYYLIYAMNLNNYANQNAQPLITGGILKGLYAALPPKQEQTEIANFLQKRTTAIDRLLKNIEAQIEKLLELRKIRIYEAVTGKIKVNAYAETTA